MNVEKRVNRRMKRSIVTDLRCTATMMSIQAVDGWADVGVSGRKMYRDRIGMD